LGVLCVLFVLCWLNWLMGDFHSKTQKHKPAEARTPLHCWRSFLDKFFVDVLLSSIERHALIQATLDSSNPTPVSHYEHYPCWYCWRGMATHSHNEVRVKASAIILISWLRLPHLVWQTNKQQLNLSTNCKTSAEYRESMK
jgi:hypothetical protein